MSEAANVHATIKGVWNDKNDEAYRQDVSHYRGVGRWADDNLWQGIGQSSLAKIRFLWRLLDRSPKSLADLVALEWGPGGGANAFGLQPIARKYYGIDISEKNLMECQRLMTAEGRPDYVAPVLLADSPATIKGRVEDVDIFLSTAVFQHFPSKDYGVEVLQAIRSVCKPGACGFIQIRFDNGSGRFKSIEDISDYERGHITATSYRLDEFWDAVANAGFKPLSLNSIGTSNHYATYFLTTE